MEDRSAIFRAEAVDSRARVEAPGALVKMGPRWTSGAFWVLLGLVLVALIAGSQIEIDNYASGVTATDAGARLVVLIPAGDVAEVTPGSPVDLGEASTTVVSGHETLSAAEVEQRFGVSVGTRSLVVTTALEPGGRPPATVRVFIDSEPVLVALVPGLKALFGDSDA